MLAMDQEGEIITHALYDEWGKPLTEPRLDGNFAGIDNINNYTGYTYDYLLDIYFAQNRFYNPDTRQFITQDPIKDGMNWYGYCEGNPLTNVDWLGLEMGYAKKFLTELSNTLSGGAALYANVSSSSFDDGTKIVYNLNSKYFVNDGYSLTINYNGESNKGVIDGFNYKPTKIGDDFYLERERFYQLLGLDTLHITYYYDRLEMQDKIESAAGLIPYNVGTVITLLGLVCDDSDNEHYEADIIIGQVRIKEDAFYRYGDFNPSAVAVASSVQTSYGLFQGKITSKKLGRVTSAMPVKKWEDSVLSQYFGTKGEQLEVEHLGSITKVVIHSLKPI